MFFFILCTKYTDMADERHVQPMHRDDCTGRQIFLEFLERHRL